MERAAPVKNKLVYASCLFVFTGAWLVSMATLAQSVSGAEQVNALQEGGYVLVIRNARSAEKPPEEGEESPANIHGEREITPYGQGEMAALSYAFRQLNIPVQKTLASPAYRSRQSASYFGFGERTVVDRLAESSEGGEASWLRERVTEMPPSGQNNVIMTHGNLISEAFRARNLGNIATGETLIFSPREAGAELVARLTVEDWAKLAVN